MNQRRELFLVPKTLDKPARILGLPYDEFIPAISLAVFFFCQKQIMTSIVVPALIVIGLRILKKGNGSSWLINLCHWYLPRSFTQFLIRETPASVNREYIA